MTCHVHGRDLRRAFASAGFDLQAKLYIPEADDLGEGITENLLDIAGIDRTLTVPRFKAI